MFALSLFALSTFVLASVVLSLFDTTGSVLLLGAIMGAVGADMTDFD